MVSKKNLTVSAVKESLVKPTTKQCGKLDMIGKNIMEIKAGGNLTQDSVAVIGDDKSSGAAAVPLKGTEVNQKDVIVTNDDGCKTTDDVQRLAVLSFEQVRRLDAVMNEVVSIQGRGNFPTIEVSLKDLVKVVRNKLEEDAATTTAVNGSSNNTSSNSSNSSNSNSYNNSVDTAVGITSTTVKVVKDIRLNGGAASYVLDTQESWQTYNDLDLIFAVELSSARHFERVKTAVLNSLLDLLPEGVSRKRISTCSLKEAYVSKMVKVNSEGDCWSLISLGNSRGCKNVELKFVDTMRRPFEFSVDSFQIVLDSLLLFYDCSDGSPISETFYPTVVGDSVYGDFQEALYHLQKKLIATRNPEEIRGGGLLKYCNLLVRHYQPAYPENIKMLERYMCSRFFIDFPDINQQRCKLENYLRNHFIEPEEESIKYQYLLLLRSVVDESTVCLMGHERRQTLALIDDLAYQVYYYSHNRKYYPHHHATAPPAATTYLYANGYYYTPTAATTLLSPCACNSYLFAAAPPSPSSATSAVNVANGSASTAVHAPPIDAAAAPPSAANGYPDLQQHCNGSNVSSPPELEVAATTIDA